MQQIPISTSRKSIDPIVALLEANGIVYQVRQPSLEVFTNSSGIIDVVVNATMWASLATVFVSFIRSRVGRKLIITTKDKTVIHAEGLSHKELEDVLRIAQNIAAIDTNKACNEESKTESD